MKRGLVWLAAAGLVTDEGGRWLVVKKRYSGLKGQWSLPAGFVDQGETMDEAAVREVKEETGIDCVVCGVAGIRTGVINEEISDNMVVFVLKVLESGQAIIFQHSELLDAAWISPEELAEDPLTSILLLKLLESYNGERMSCLTGVSPGEQFGYTKYSLFA